MTLIYPFILSGGSGTRLWPLSRRAYPKQFLAVTGGDKSLFQQSCERFASSSFAPPIVLGSEDHRFIIAEQMREIGISPQAIVLEPCARNTAPAAAVAALMASRQAEDAVLLLAPSDHIITNNEDFLATIQRGLPAARKGALITFGVTPSEPHTGYGYIDSEGTGDVLGVKRFVEKPNIADAMRYVDAGNFYWNAGIFLMSTAALLEAFQIHSPEVLRVAERALRKSQIDFDFMRLDEHAYSHAPDISIDYAIMEKSENVRCVPLATDWSDLGSWPAVWEAVSKDDAGNAAQGDVIFQDAQNCFAHAENGCVAIVGLSDVMVVATKDAVLVTSKEHAQSVKKVVEKLDASGRQEVIFHKRVYRPWGWFEGLDAGERFQVKRIMVKPGAQLSLQSHFHRAEHWIVVCGTLQVTINDQIQLVEENHSTYIPLGARHRLANPGRIPAYLIEVQSGPYLGEDDIVRYEDVYGRGDI